MTEASLTNFFCTSISIKRKSYQIAGMPVEKKDFIRVPGIDIDIQIVFRARHLPLLAPFFKRAGVTADAINRMIDEHISSGEVMPFERWVLEYGQSKLNPLMNAYLKRDSKHKTFNSLLKVALKEHLENDPVLRQLKRPLIR